MDQYLLRDQRSPLKARPLCRVFAMGQVVFSPLPANK